MSLRGDRSRRGNPASPKESPGQQGMDGDLSASLEMT